MQLWDVDVKPHGGSRPRGLSVNGWLGMADLGLAVRGPGILTYNPETFLFPVTRYLSVNISRRALTRVPRNVAWQNYTITL
jgi:hypothetical protein